MKISPRILVIYEKYMAVIGVAGNLLFYLQAFKIMSSRSAQGVSLSGFIISLLSLMSWLLYGIMINNKLLVGINAFGVIGAIICVTSIIAVSN